MSVHTKPCGLLMTNAAWKLNDAETNYISTWQLARLPSILLVCQASPVKTETPKCYWQLVTCLLKFAVKS